VLPRPTQGPHGHEHSGSLKGPSCMHCLRPNPPISTQCAKHGAYPCATCRSIALPSATCLSEALSLGCPQQTCQGGLIPNLAFSNQPSEVALHIGIKKVERAIGHLRRHAGSREALNGDVSMDSMHAVKVCQGVRRKEMLSTYRGYHNAPSTSYWYFIFTLCFASPTFAVDPLASRGTYKIRRY